MTPRPHGSARWSSARRGLLALVAVALVATACGGNDGNDAAAGEIEHVHGLGIDPADGMLYAATHTGLFRVPETGAVERVGQSRQDTMGFTVVGANRFLGSGHPDPADDELPPQLGLIESTDAGRTWEPRSMLGEADFHALAARHDLVYAYDATQQRFMVTGDGTEWDLRSSPPGLISLAVDPTDPDRLVATTTSGVITSTDGGRSWNTIEAPVLAWVSWADDGTLAGAGPNGGIHVSTDGATSWSEAGALPGSPEALLAIDRQALVAAVSEQGLFRSDDGGATWTSIPRDDGS
jgi:photosystem II stability/assembly factor-like uncharacterized protein